MSQNIEGTVQAVKQREGGYSIRVDNAWFGGFGSLPCKKGDNVKIKFEVSNEGWNNIAQEDNAVVVTGQGQVSSEDTKSKSVWVALSYAKDLAAAGKIKLEEIEEKAKGFLEIYQQLIKL